MRVYIAGPMRNLPEFNFPAFMEAAQYLERPGHEVVNPAQHDLDTGFNPAGMLGSEDLSDTFNLAEALAWDLDQITKCEAIFFLDGWQHSSGARAEYALAQALGLFVGSQEQQRSENLDALLGAPLFVKMPYFTQLYGLPHERVPAEPVTDEVRVVSATGGEKGQKLAQVGSVDPAALLEVAKVAGFGATKYARLNFMKGYDWSLSFDAMQRHLLLFWSGQDKDDESGLPHVAHAAWHCLALLAFSIHGLGTDDRYRKD